MSRAMGRNREDLEAGFTNLLPPKRIIACFLSPIVAVTLFMVNKHLLADLPCRRQDEAVPNNEEKGYGEDRFRLHRTRSNLPAVRFRLAQLDRDFDELDYADLRALDEDITPVAPSTSEGDNNARYMVQSHVHTRNPNYIATCAHSFLGARLNLRTGSRNFYRVENQSSAISALWLVVVAAMCLIACVLWMYPICQHRQEEALAAPGNDLRWHSEQRVYVPPLATRAQLSDVRIQLALLDRDFDYRDYDALRALDDDITPAASTMGEEDVNALPVHGNNSHHIAVDHHD